MELDDLYLECVNLIKSIGYSPAISEVRLNNRLTRTYGRYFENEKIIEINKKVFNSATKEQNMITIIHEITHNLDHLLNGHTSEDLDGHGESWQKIADDVSSKLGITIQRYSPFTCEADYSKEKEYHYTYKCTECGGTKTVLSKQKDNSLVRKGKCRYCGSKILDFLFNGQYGINLNTGERIMIAD